MPHDTSCKQISAAPHYFENNYITFCKEGEVGRACLVRMFSTAGACKVACRATLLSAATEIVWRRRNVATHGGGAVFLGLHLIDWILIILIIAQLWTGWRKAFLVSLGATAGFLAGATAAFFCVPLMALSLIHISEPTRLLSISYAVFCLKKKKKIKKKKKKNFFFFFLMIRRPPRSTPKPSSAASDVYKRQKAFQISTCRYYEKSVST